MYLAKRRYGIKNNKNERLLFQSTSLSAHQLQRLQSWSLPQRHLHFRTRQNWTEIYSDLYVYCGLYYCANCCLYYLCGMQASECFEAVRNSGNASKTWKQDERDMFSLSEPSIVATLTGFML